MKNLIKKIAWLSFSTTICSCPLFGQHLHKGEINLRLGVGVGNTFVTSSTTVFPMPNFTFDYALANSVTIGGYLGFTQGIIKYARTILDSTSITGHVSYQDIYTWNFLLSGIKATYHFCDFIKKDKLDLYLGATVGYNYATSKLVTNSPYPSQTHFPAQSYGGMIYSGFIGGSYRFASHLSFFSELGYGITYLNAGFLYSWGDKTSAP